MTLLFDHQNFLNALLLLTSVRVHVRVQHTCLCACVCDRNVAVLQCKHLAFFVNLKQVAVEIGSWFFHCAPKVTRKSSA